MYSGMVIANIVLGFVIPQIDNAAHLGGLLSGVVFTYALLRARPNRLITPNLKKARLVLASFLIVLGVGGVVASSPQFLLMRLNISSHKSEDPRLQFRYLGQILNLTPNDDNARLQRLELSLRYGNYSTAKEDFFQLIRRPDQNGSKIKRIEAKLSESGHREAAHILRGFWGNVGSDL